MCNNGKNIFININNTKTLSIIYCRFLTAVYKTLFKYYEKNPDSKGLK